MAVSVAKVFDDLEAATSSCAGTQRVFKTGCGKFVAAADVNAARAAFSRFKGESFSPATKAPEVSVVDKLTKKLGKMTPEEIAKLKALLEARDGTQSS